MSERLWQNLAKYFYDISKLVLGVAVVTQLAGLGNTDFKVVAFGIVAGLLFLIMGMFFDRRGDVPLH